MKIYKLHKKQVIPVTIDRAWKFFSDPANLQKITPEDLNFKILTDQSDKIYLGLIIAYKIHPILGIPVTWVTEITQVREGNYFIDEQRFGPYKFWHHEHIFRTVRGGTEIDDLVYYAMPLWIFGDIVHEVLVKYEIEKIFKFRSDILTKIFQ